MNIIVVGDAHAKPGISNERFTWLGRLINDLKPDIVLETGDWADMPSLSSYDGSVLTGGGAKKASFEGKRYKVDVQASRDAYDRVDHEIRKAKKKTPHRISLGGNHCEGRINRALQLVPELEGLLDISELHSPCGNMFLSCSLPWWGDSLFSTT